MATVFEAPLVGHVFMRVVVSDKDRERFVQRFPEARIALRSVWRSEDPIADVERMLEEHKKREKADGQLQNQMGT